MSDRVSRVHWHVQTRTPEGGWITRCQPEHQSAAILAAETFATDFNVAARVLLGTTQYYFVDPADVEVVPTIARPTV